MSYADELLGVISRDLCNLTRHVVRLGDDDIRKEAVRMIKRQMEQEAAEEYKRQLLYEQQQKEEQAVRNLLPWQQTNASPRVSS